MITLVGLSFCLILIALYLFFPSSSLVITLCFVIGLDSCDERVMRTGVDDNKSNDQQNECDEIIEDMKYDFLSLPTFFLFSLSHFLFALCLYLLF